jgi:hypothetical protein
MLREIQSEIIGYGWTIIVSLLTLSRRKHLRHLLSPKECEKFLDIMPGTIIERMFHHGRDRELSEVLHIPEEMRPGFDKRL